MKKCPYCGKEYPDDATICAIDEYRLDGSLKETTSNQDKSPTAGFGIRVLARLIDAIFGTFVALVAGLVIGKILYILGTDRIIAPGWQHRIHNFSIASIGLSILAGISYHSFCEGIHGATLGKLCCGLCVMGEDMKPNNLKSAIIRSFAYCIDGLFCGLVGYTSMSESPLNQRYGDVWGKTVVVKINELAPELRQPRELFFLGLATGTGYFFCIMCLSLIVKAL